MSDDSLQYKVTIDGADEAERAVRGVEDALDDATGAAVKNNQVLGDNKEAINKTKNATRGMSMGLINLQETISKTTQKTVNYSHVVNDVFDALIIGGPQFFLFSAAIAGTALAIRAFTGDAKAMREEIEKAEKAVAEGIERRVKTLEATAAAAERRALTFGKSATQIAQMDAELAQQTSESAIKAQEAAIEQFETQIKGRSVVIQLLKKELDEAGLDDKTRVAKEKELNRLLKEEQDQHLGEAVQGMRKSLEQQKKIAEAAASARVRIEKAGNELINKERERQAEKDEEAARKRTQRAAKAAAEQEQRAEQAALRMADAESKRFVNELQRETKRAQDELERFGAILSEEQRRAREKVIEQNKEYLRALGGDHVIAEDEERRSLEKRLKEHKEHQRALDNLLKEAAREREKRRKAELKQEEKATKKLQNSMMRSGQMITGGLADAMSNFINDAVRQEEHAAERAAAAGLESTGRQLVGFGVKTGFEGAALMAMGNVPQGTAMLGIAAAATAAGAAMGAGGAAIAAGIPTSDGGAAVSEAALTTGPDTGTGGAVGEATGQSVTIVNNYGAAGPNANEAARRVGDLIGRFVRQDRFGSQRAFRGQVVGDF